MQSAVGSVPVTVLHDSKECNILDAGLVDHKLAIVNMRHQLEMNILVYVTKICLLYTSDAADE